MLFSLYKHTDGGVFDNFSKISDHFPKISEDFWKLFRRPDKRSRIPEHFPRISEDVRRFPKIAEDFRGRPEDVSMIHQWIYVQFTETHLISVKSSIYFIHTEIFASNFALWKSVSDFTSTNQRGERSFSHVKKSFRPITNHGLSELCFRGLFRGHRG